MMIAIRRLLGDSRASTAIEFALLAGPFLLMVFGVIEFSRALWTRQVLANIATETARCVAVVQHECADSAGSYSRTKATEFVKHAARDLGVSLLDPITIKENTTCDGLAGFASVEVIGNFDSLFPADWIMSFTGHSCFARQI